jgi:hypothetical protein
MTPEHEKALLDLCKDLGWNRVDPPHEFLRRYIYVLRVRAEDAEVELEGARLEIEELNDKLLEIECD